MPKYVDADCSYCTLIGYTTGPSSFANFDTRSIVMIALIFSSAESKEIQAAAISDFQWCRKQLVTKQIIFIMLHPYLIVPPHFLISQNLNTIYLPADVKKCFCIREYNTE